MNLVLTGSSTGIGRALAERLLARGHRVWGLARSDQSAFAAQHPNFNFSRCDVADYSAVSAAAAEVSAHFSHLDALVTAAGVQGEIAPALAANPANWSATVRANLDGTFFALRAFAPLLNAAVPARSPSPAASRKKIVCFSGGGATKPRANFSAYGVAKTAIVRLVETIAEETRGQPLDINALAPGAINTRLTDEVLALGPAIVGAAEFASAQKQKAASAADSAATLSRALDCVEWLLSPASDGLSGRLLSAPWDPWPMSPEKISALAPTDIYTLRRIVPDDRREK